jgi:hypothetical protein
MEKRHKRYIKLVPKSKVPAEAWVHKRVNSIEPSGEANPVDELLALDFQCSPQPSLQKLGQPEVSNPTLHSANKWTRDSGLDQNYITHIKQSNNFTKKHQTPDFTNDYL